MSNLKSVAFTVLELLAFNAKKLGGDVTLAMPPFEKFLMGSYPDCPWEHHEHSCQIQSPSGIEFDAF